MIEDVVNVILLETGRFVTFPVTEQVERVAGVSVGSQGGQQVGPIKKRGGQPVN